MARERYTAEQMIDACRKAHGLKSVMAASLRCDRMTVENYARRYPTVQQALDDEREWIVDLAEGKMLQAINSGEPWAIALILRTLGKRRGYGDQLDINIAQTVRVLAQQAGLSDAETDAAVAEAERVTREARSAAAGR